MTQFLRYTCSGIMALVVTVALFVGMLNLLDSQHHIFSEKVLNFGISYVKTEIDTKHRKRQIKKPPERQKSSQPPAAPRMNVIQNENAIINLPNEFDNGHNFNILEKIDLPGFSIQLNDTNIDSQGGLKAGIPPIYPPAALLKNTEGWVQVKILVNEFGMVNDVLVMNANPARIFDNAAIKAVRKWKFYPNKVNGKSTPYETTQTIEFKLDQPIELD